MNIYGSGGGGGDAPRTPIEESDSLKATEYARIIDIISEGEIHGLVDGLKSVYIQGTQYKNSDDTLNFKGVTVSIVPGTPNQSYMPGFSFSEAEVPVNVPVPFATPVSRTISNPLVTSARVRIAVPTLVKQLENGDRVGSSVPMAIDVKPSGGAFTRVITDTITGKCSSKYVRQHVIPLAGSAPWVIRVSRLSEESNVSTLIDEVRFDTYTEVIDVKLRRPNLAAAYVQADSAQFSTVPERSYLCRGRIIRIPANYNPVTRIYTGVWDGTFKLGYTDNPAWIYQDLVTHDRYGIAKYIPNVEINKWRLYEISKYNDELVQDGFGGFEPRFTCHVYLQERTQAYTLLNTLASNFNSKPSYSGEDLLLMQDSPQDATYIYSPANVIGGKFTYSGVSRSAQHSSVNVVYNDKRNHYKRAMVSVSDDALIAKKGYKQLEITAYGCTSPGQAVRVARRVIYTEAVETEMVAFEVGLDTLNMEAGDVIKIADPLRKSNNRFGGRILKGSTVNVVNVDAWVDVGTSPSITIKMPSGALETKQVQSVIGTALTLASPLSAVPNDNTMWIAQGSNTKPTYWRVLSITENTGAKRITFSITALAHDPAKYAAIDDVGILKLPDAPPLPTTTSPVSGITINESTIVVNDTATGRIDVNWLQSLGAKSYKVSYKFDDGNWSSEIVFTSSFELTTFVTGQFYVSISPVSNLGVPGPATKAEYTVVGEYRIPPAPLGLQLNGSFDSNIVRVKWDPVGRAAGYNVRVRSGPLVTDTTIDTQYVNAITSFEYDVTQMLAANGGVPRRSFTIDVQTVGLNGLSSITNASLNVSNTAPALPYSLNYAAIPGALLVEFDKPTDSDFKDVKVWMSTVSGFTPSNANLTAVVTSSPAVIVSDINNVAIVPGVTYYMRTAVADTYGDIGLNISAESAITAVNNPLGTGVVLTSDSRIFRSDANGLGVNPTSITLKPIPTQDLVGVTPTWSVLPNTVVLGGTSTEKTLDTTLLTGIDSVAVKVSYTLSGSVYESTVTIVRIKDGQAGLSSRKAYTSVPNIVTLELGQKTSIGINSLPATNSWGAGEEWYVAAPAYAVGYGVWETNGIFNPATGHVTWDSPYVSAVNMSNESLIINPLGTNVDVELRWNRQIGGSASMTWNGNLIQASKPFISQELGINNISSTEPATPFAKQVWLHIIP